MKIALITGVTGQDGSYLAELLLQKQYKVWGIIRRSSDINTQRIEHLYGMKNFILRYGDMTDSPNLLMIMHEIKTTYENFERLEIYNLAAMSHVKVSFEMPEYCANADGTGTVKNAVLETTGDQVVGAGGDLTFMEKMASVPSKIADKITNPDTLANLTLQAGGQLLATTLVPPGSMPDLSAEEQQVLEEYKAELADLKQNNEAAFNAKMDASKQFLVQAGYFSPEYFGLQSANKAATDQERKLREYRRTAGLTSFRNTGMSAAEERRAALDSGRNVQSAYDSGFQKGMTAQNQALTTGYGMIPASQGAGYANALAGLGTMYSGMREQQDKKRDNIAEFFGGLNVASGNSEEDKKKLKDIKDGKAPQGGLNLDGQTIAV